MIVHRHFFDGGSLKITPTPYTLQSLITNFTVQDTSVNDKVETIDLDGTIVLDSTVESDTEMEEVTQDVNKEVEEKSSTNTSSISTPTRQHSSSSTGSNVVSKTEPGKIFFIFFCNIEFLIIGHCFF